MSISFVSLYSGVKGEIYQYYFKNESYKQLESSTLNPNSCVNNLVKFLTPCIPGSINSTWWVDQSHRNICDRLQRPKCVLHFP